MAVLWFVVADAVRTYSTAPIRLGASNKERDNNAIMLVTFVSICVL